jgi:hypothetical protein
MFTRDCPGRDSSQYNEYMSQLAYVIKTIDVSDYLTTDSDQQWNYVILVIVMLLKMSWVLQTKPHLKKTHLYIFGMGIKTLYRAHKSNVLTHRFTIIRNHN